MSHIFCIFFDFHVPLSFPFLLLSILFFPFHFLLHSFPNILLSFPSPFNSFLSFPFRFLLLSFPFLPLPSYPINPSSSSSPFLPLFLPPFSFHFYSYSSIRFDVYVQFIKLLETSTYLILCSISVSSIILVI